MAFVSEMIDELRDLLVDPDDEQVPLAMKRVYLNQGISNMWPSMFRLVTASLIPIVAATPDYSLPAAVADGFITSVEISTTDTSVFYQRLNEYDIIFGDEDSAGILRLGLDSTSFAAYDIRVTYAAPCSPIVGTTYAAMQAETWVGPDRARHLPVFYAMAMCSLRKVDDRQDYKRVSTTQMTNGTTDNDIMQSSQLWMSQFELELDKLSRPLPVARD